MPYKVKYSRKDERSSREAKKELKKNKSLNQNNEELPSNWIDLRGIEDYVFI